MEKLALLDISTAIRHHSGDVVLGDLEISLEMIGADDVQAMKYIEVGKNTSPIYIGSTSSTTVFADDENNCEYKTASAKGPVILTLVS